MVSNKSNQIFYDSDRKRWRYSKRMAILVAAFFSIIFGVSIASLIIGPVLPAVNLNKPQAKFRKAPNVPISTPNNAASQNLLPLDLGSEKKAVGGNAGKRMISFYVNWDDNSLTSLKANITHIDELIPEWYHLADGNGKIAVDNRDRQNEVMDFVRSSKAELAVVPLINNFSQQKQDWDPELLSAMLSNPQARTTLIADLKDEVLKNDFKGISIDFESVPDNQQNNLALFMQELYGNFHPLGLEVSQNVPLDDDSFDLKKLASFSDFLILMAYDEHSALDSSAGPVASQRWFTTGISKQLKAVSSEKIVVAVGSYGYDWVDGQSKGEEVTFQDAIRTARESEGTISLEKNSLNPTFDYYDENDILHHVWFLDATTIFNEMRNANQLGNIKGFALWRLGSEDPAMWNIYDSKSELNYDSAKSMEKMEYGYDISYEGTGEILKVTALPKQGKREIAYDDRLGLILDEKIIDYPSSYEITRWGTSDAKKIAITFDDGPDPVYTEKILDILKAHDIKATFFVIGANANLHQNILRRIIKEGHEIGNHTYSHPNISLIPEEQFRLELDATERLFEGILGRKSMLFRPPYAEDIEPETPQQVQPLIHANVLGYYTVGMHIDPHDWSKPGADQIAQSVINSAQNGEGNIVILHDSGGNRQETVDALEKIITTLKSGGFEFVSISNLMGVSYDELMPKISQREQILARVNESAFTTVSLFNHLLYLTFFIGIIFGITRFIFIAVLAIAQWIHSKKINFYKTYPPYEPLIDVIIPAYNEEKVICKTVASILHSNYRNYHILVIDDGSKDDTYGALKRMYGNFPQISIYRKTNSGKSDALNFGIERSIGEIIITLDADTFFKVDTIEKLVRRFRDPKIAAVAGNAKVGNRTNILTRWQALEYVVSQNFDRRAFEIINCISVVPGAVGAWRRKALLEAGGFSSATLAEDADLTFAILKNGHHVAYEDQAIGITEAPDNVRNFIKQRFRWMYGMMQTAWKHHDVFLKPKFGALGFFAIPNLLIFQIFFPLISPFMDLMLIVSLLWAFWQKQHYQVDFSTSQTLEQILIFYIFFTVFDLITAVLPFLFERREDWKLILWMPLQRFFYRQLMYYVAIKSVVAVIRGRIVKWGKFERSATVDEEN